MRLILISNGKLPSPHKLSCKGNEAMIVCVCNNISDREIRQAIDLGISSVAELHRELGVGTMCGTCVSYAREVLNEHLESKTTITEVRRVPQAA